MSEWNLTADEWLLVYLTFLAQDEEGHPEYFSKWFKNGGQSKLRDLFNSLKEKNIIKKNYNPEKYIPNDIEFNKQFVNKYIKHSGELGKELFDAYTPFVFINGKNYSLKNISKKFYSLEEFYFYYSVNIGHSISKHNEVMQWVKYAKDHNLLRYNIIEFVASHKWDEIKYINENNLDGEILTTSDIYREL